MFSSFKTVLLLVLGSGLNVVLGFPFAVAPFGRHPFQRTLQKKEDQQDQAQSKTDPFALLHNPLGIALDVLPGTRMHPSTFFPAVPWFEDIEKNPVQKWLQQQQRQLTEHLQQQMDVAPPQRRYETNIDNTTGDLMVQVFAPEGSASSFDIEVDDVARTLKISEEWVREHSGDTEKGTFASKSKGLFSKGWRIPSAVKLDQISAKWNDEDHKLVVRMPSQPLIEEGKDSTTKQIKAESAEEETCHEESKATGTDVVSIESAADKTNAEEADDQKVDAKEKAVQALQNQLQLQRQLRQQQHNRLEQLRQQHWRQRHREAEKRQRELHSQQQKLHQTPQCASGVPVLAVYQPNGLYYHAHVKNVDEEAGQLVVMWDDGDTSFTSVPLRQKYVRGCKIKAPHSGQAKVEPTKQTDEEASATSPDQSESKPTGRKIEPISEASTGDSTDTPQQKQTGDNPDDEFEIIEEWFTEDDLEGQEKDADASEGYFMFGEFHPF